jgi:hypothetical protein
MHCPNQPVIKSILHPVRLVFGQYFCDRMLEIIRGDREGRLSGELIIKLKKMQYETGKFYL